MSDVYERSLELHRASVGKISMTCRSSIWTMDDLSLVYTPGVAEACRRIEQNPDDVYRYTSKGDWVAVVTDGSAVLGLGDIGPAAALPVMEGKCCLFKRFAGIDAYPLCIDQRDPDAFVDTVASLTASFGGINLEDIAAPRCFEIEKKLQARCNIPVFHDDQHGTAVVVLGAFKNALRFTGRQIGSCRIVINGMGAAGTCITEMLIAAGARDVVCCDRWGVLDPSDERITDAQRRMCNFTNPDGIKGSLADAMGGADACIGVSKPGLVTGDMIQSMNSSPIVFAMANPTPEIFPDEAACAGAAVVATGRSDFPNQVNNCLGFPGIFRGALDVRAACVDEAMKLAAADALASLIADSELSAVNILPQVFDPRVVPAVSSAVAEAARKSGLART